MQTYQNQYWKLIFTFNLPIEYFVNPTHWYIKTYFNKTNEGKAERAFLMLIYLLTLAFTSLEHERGFLMLICLRNPIQDKTASVFVMLIYRLSLPLGSIRKTKLNVYCWACLPLPQEKWMCISNYVNLSIDNSFHNLPQDKIGSVFLMLFYLLTLPLTSCHFFNWNVFCQEPMRKTERVFPVLTIHVIIP